VNAYVERFVRSMKEECLNRMIFLGQASLRRAVTAIIKVLAIDCFSPKQRLQPAVPYADMLGSREC
jgi:hypothetical protein